jgi:HEAT repeat protein
MGANSGSLVTIETNAIENEPSVNARTEDARKLADQVHRNGLAVSDADIKLLADMLSDRDDSIRYWIAMALGYIGPRAQPAVPALEKALQEVQCVPGSKTSASAIRLALIKIGATARHQDCS